LDCFQIFRWWIHFLYDSNSGFHVLVQELSMSEKPRENQTQTPLWRALLPRSLMGLTGLALFTAAWFGLAGRLNWLQGWSLLLFFLVFTLTLSLRMAKLNPDLVRERTQSSSAAEPWDQALMKIYSVTLILMLIVAAIDGGRFEWSTVPITIQILGWVMLALTGAVIWHVTSINAYLSSWARLQDDRGQEVVKDGLYGVIRHPMYLGVILFVLAIPLVLGSWFALVPGLLIIGLFIYRTWREDQMLLAGLAGYQDYIQKVRYRLIPGLW
jgi:protein-S-isoprenylcysteine O-methyltransferase Ste14